MTSSTVTYVGHISQSNYAASNAVLDNLARQRISMGLPVTTISLGPIKGVSTLNRKPEYAEHLLRSGLIEAEESEFIRHFERFTYPQPVSKHFDNLTQGHILTGVEYSKHDLSMVQVTRIEQDRRWALLVTTLESPKSASNMGIVVADASGDDLLLSKIPEDRDKAVIVLAEAVSQRLAKLMFMPIEEIDISRPFSHFGIDSMSGSELIHWLSQKFGVIMSFLQLLAPSCTPKRLSGTIFDTLMKTKAAVDTEESHLVANDTSETESNGAHATNESHAASGYTESGRMTGSNGVVDIASSSEMDKFSQAVRRAIIDPKPVMHSYVCSVVNGQGAYLTQEDPGQMSLLDILTLPQVTNSTHYPKALCPKSPTAKSTLTQSTGWLLSQNS